MNKAYCLGEFCDLVFLDSCGTTHIFENSICAVYRNSDSAEFNDPALTAW